MSFLFTDIFSRVSIVSGTQEKLNKYLVSQYPVFLDTPAVSSWVGRRKLVGFKYMKNLNIKISENYLAGN